MKIQFKLPAIAIDDDGAEQEIELAFEVIPAHLFTQGGRVTGDFMLLGGGMSGGLQASFAFHAEHPFSVTRRPTHSENEPTTNETSGGYHG